MAPLDSVDRARHSRAMAADAIKSAAASTIARQSAGYVASALVINVLALITTIALTRVLSVETYAQYAFCINLLVFLSLFFELGMFYPASQLITRATGQEAKALTGASILLWIGSSALFTTFLLALTLGPLQALFEVEVTDQLRSVAPLAGAWIATQLTVLLAQGHGRLHVFSASSAGSSVLLLACVYGVLASDTRDNATLMLVLYGAASLTGSLACLAWFRPTFHSVGSSSRSILAQTRAWGLKLFVGRVLSMATYRLDVLMLGMFAGGAPVANYVLATALTAPVSLPGIASSTALFQRLASSARINRNWLVLPLLLAVGATLLLAVVGSDLVDLLFPENYAGVSTLLLPLSLAAILQGTTSLFNKFLAAHRQGRELRTSALWLTAANITLNVLLIPPFAAAGAAWASVLALVVNLLAHLFGYRRSVQALSRTTVETMVEKAGA